MELRRVHWEDEMLVEAAHFTTLEGWIENLVALRWTTFDDFGIARMDGQVEVVEASEKLHLRIDAFWAVTPAGEILSAAKSGNYLIEEIEELPRSGDELSVYLVGSRDRREGSVEDIKTYEKGFRLVARSVDDTTVENGSEIARLRKRNGHYEIRKDFLPHCVSVRSIPAVSKRVQKIVNIISELRKTCRREVLAKYAGAKHHNMRLAQHMYLAHTLLSHWPRSSSLDVQDPRVSPRSVIRTVKLETEEANKDLSALVPGRFEESKEKLDNFPSDFADLGRSFDALEGLLQSIYSNFCTHLELNPPRTGELTIVSIERRKNKRHQTKLFLSGPLRNKGRKIKIMLGLDEGLAVRIHPTDTWGHVRVGYRLTASADGSVCFEPDEEMASLDFIRIISEFAIPVDSPEAIDIQAVDIY